MALWLSRAGLHEQSGKQRRRNKQDAYSIHGNVIRPEIGERVALQTLSSDFSPRL
jgi:hypothetical protein